MPKKLTYEQVKSYIELFEEEKLLSKEYNNAHEKLEIICSYGYIYGMNYASFQQGHRCPKCAKKKHDQSHGFIKM